MITDNQATYAVKLANQIAAIFDEECENFIDKNDLLDENKATDFFHALTCAAHMFYTSLTGDKVDVLGYNHIANRLILQNSKVEKNG